MPLQMSFQIITCSVSLYTKSKWEDSILRKRLIRWIFFNLIFALTPLTVVLIFRWTTDQLTMKAMEDNLAEILFFALMVSVTVVGDIFDAIKVIDKDNLLYGLMMFFILGSAFSAILYGAFQFDCLIGTNIQVFRPRLMWLSIIMAFILFITSTGTQVFLGRIADLKDEVQA